MYLLRLFIASDLKKKFINMYSEEAVTCFECQTTRQMLSRTVFNIINDKCLSEREEEKKPVSLSLAEFTI